MKDIWVSLAFTSVEPIALVDIPAEIILLDHVPSMKTSTESIIVLVLFNSVILSCGVFITNGNVVGSAIFGNGNDKVVVRIEETWFSKAISK